MSKLVGLADLFSTAPPPVPKGARRVPSRYSESASHPDYVEAPLKKNGHHLATEESIIPLMLSSSWAQLIVEPDSGEAQ